MNLHRNSEDSSEERRIGDEEKAAVELVLTEERATYFNESLKTFFAHRSTKAKSRIRLVEHKVL